MQYHCHAFRPVVVPHLIDLAVCEALQLWRRALCFQRLSLRNITLVDYAVYIVRELTVDQECQVVRYTIVV